MVGWLDRLQRRNRAVGVVVAVVYKYLDDQGGYLSALITYYGFVSLFPLLLLLTTGLGIVLAGHPDLQEQVLHSTLSQFPVIGSQLHQPEGLSGGTVAVVVGIAGALYGGLGVGQAVQNAMDSVWAIPRNNRPNPIRSRLRSLLLLLVLGSAATTATVLSAVGQATGALGAVGKVGVALATVAINAFICLVAFRLTTARNLTYRQVLPGALAAAVIWQILQYVGGYFISHQLAHASPVYGTFAVVIGLLAWLYLEAELTLYAVQINVVIAFRLWPRSIAPPPYTEQDRQAFQLYAQMEERSKTEDVAVEDPDSEGEDNREKTSG